MSKVDIRVELAQKNDEEEFLKSDILLIKEAMSKKELPEAELGELGKRWEEAVNWTVQTAERVQRLLTQKPLFGRYQIVVNARIMGEFRIDKNWFSTPSYSLKMDLNQIAAFSPRRLLHIYRRLREVERQYQEMEARLRRLIDLRFLEEQEYLDEILREATMASLINGGPDVR